VTAVISNASNLRIGVLALQGDFREHLEAFRRLGEEPVAVKNVDQLKNVDALVIPGGESTTITRLLKLTDLFDAIRQRATNDELAVMGTCAGMIVSAREVLDGRADQTSLGLFDATVRRNAAGRQRFSFEAEVTVDGFEEPFPIVFIRGPGVEETGADVQILARWEGAPVLCAQGPHLFATFHPELTADDRVHRLFLERVKTSKGLSA
jgi:pyridoxal 5'-phosphate synthase pdxT subunit